DVLDPEVARAAEVTAPPVPPALRTAACAGRVGLVVVGRLEPEPRDARGAPAGEGVLPPGAECWMRTACGAAAGRRPWSRSAKERPSTKVGTRAPARRANVGAKSTLPTSARDVEPARTSGPRTSSGTRTSSSKAVCLPAGSRCCPLWNPLSEGEHTERLRSCRL